MRRFANMEAAGKQCILLYCGDHDPGGLAISDHLRPNLKGLAHAVCWSPDDLIIDRFGLNHDFIEREGLSWIENLETSSGGNLNDTRHKDHCKPYVQNYIEQFGARKVEANALVTRVEAGRKLCREAILEYLDEDDPKNYQAALEVHQEKAREAITELFIERAAQ